MLNYIHLENFRAFGKATTIPLAPITLLFGENSAGKTSILHALSLLKQTAASEDRDVPLVARDSNGLVDLGSFSEFAFEHNTKRMLKIGLGFRTPHSDDVRGPLVPFQRFRMEGAGRHWAFRQAGLSGDVEPREIDITDGLTDTPLVTLHRAQESDLPDRVRVPIDPMSRRLKDWFAPRPDSFSATAIGSLQSVLREHREALLSAIAVVEKELASREPSGEGISPDMGGYLKREWNRHQTAVAELKRTVLEGADVRACREMARMNWGSAVSLTGLFTDSYIDRTSSSLLQRILDRNLLTSEAMLRAVDSLMAHPLLRCRAYLDGSNITIRRLLRNYIPIGPVREAPARYYIYSGTRPSQVGRRGEHVPDLLHRDADTLKRANKWLRRFEIGYQLKLRSLKRGLTGIFEMNLVDSRRASRIEIAFADVGFGISQMLPIVVQAVGSKGRLISIEQPEVHIHPRLQAEIGDLLVDCMQNNGHQFLVETHSEHLMLRLRKLVREKKLKPSDITVIHIRRGKEGSIANQIGVNEDGTFTHEWPGGFFPERMKELR